MGRLRPGAARSRDRRSGPAPDRRHPVGRRRGLDRQRNRRPRPAPPLPPPTSGPQSQPRRPCRHTCARRVRRHRPRGARHGGALDRSHARRARGPRYRRRPHPARRRRRSRAPPRGGPDPWSMLADGDARRPRHRRTTRPAKPPTSPRETSKRSSGPRAPDDTRLEEATEDARRGAGRRSTTSRWRCSTSARTTCHPSDAARSATRSRPASDDTGRRWAKPATANFLPEPGPASHDPAGRRRSLGRWSR